MTQPWMQKAWSYLNVAEIPGAEHNPQIVRFFELARNSGIKDDETPWCAAFVGACLEEAGIKSTRRLNARSYEAYGTPLSMPRVGAIGVLPRGGQPHLGHVVFVAGVSETHVQGLAGNQDNKVSVVSYPIGEFVAFRWPPVPAAGGQSRTVKKVDAIGTDAAKGLIGAPALGGFASLETVQSYGQAAAKWQGAFDQIGSFVSFLSSHLYLVVGLAVAYFALRIARSLSIIKWLRFEDECTGAHVDRAAEAAIAAQVSPQVREAADDRAAV